MNNYNANNVVKQQNGNQFLNSENINCIAICEGIVVLSILISLSVINSEIRKHGTIWVQPNSDYVVTRFFFVYTSGNVGMNYAS